MNQLPEEQARDECDRLLRASGWLVQSYKRIDLSAGPGVAVREYPTDTGPADYILFVDGKPVGVIEAKKQDEAYHLNLHEGQVEEYAQAKLKYLDNEPLPFVYLSTGTMTGFVDARDPKPRMREVFSFHRPETLRDWLERSESLRASFAKLGALATEGLRDCQIAAITGLERSFKRNAPRALVQMATGSGKTYTAITAVYRLLKNTQARRILFLVDTRNLGEQAEQEFLSYLPTDDNRKFSELYGVCRLQSRSIPADKQVYISTIQRLYAALRGREAPGEDEVGDLENPYENERAFQGRAPAPVEYSEALPPEFFDVIVVDECHRSIYNLWRQVLDYFDAFQVGLTATPDARTIAYFKRNVVSEYSHEEAVMDGVNVGYNLYLIETKITKRGGTIWKGEQVEFRDRLTREKRFELQDEDEAYSAKQLDRDVVNPNQIRAVIQTFRDHLPAMFPDRYDAEGQFEVPKTLIFAKTDSHADDIIRIVREEFGEENRFCKKVTYKADEDPKSILTSFRNDYYPRIAVTVDMIATGTDVRPLECLLFMRDVRSRNYFEQMKGRGTRVIDYDDLRKVSPTAKVTKDHFILVDAVGVTKSLKTDSRPLDKKPGVPLKELLAALAAGARDEALFTTVAGRLARLDRQLTDDEKKQFAAKAKGQTIPQVAKGLLGAYDPDRLEALRKQVEKELPDATPKEREKRFKKLHETEQDQAARVFTGELNEFIENVRRIHEQKIDHANPDEVLHVGWDKDQVDQARGIVDEFKAWLEAHRDEVDALSIFYHQPYRRREVTYAMVRELAEKLRQDRPALAIPAVWRAYEQLEAVEGTFGHELTALVALVRHVTGLDETLTAYDKTVARNFQSWVMQKQAGPVKFNDAQMTWLRMIKDHIATSMHIEVDDLDYTPFNDLGGRGRMFQLFGADMNAILDELNEALAG